MIKRDIILSYEKEQFIESAPYFKIHKCPSNFAQPPYEYAHHPYFLDFKTEKIKKKVGVADYSFNLDQKPNYDDFKKLSIPSSTSQHELDEKKKYEILHLLNTLSDSYFFVYNNLQSWTVNIDKEMSSSYTQEMYLPPPDYKEPKKIVIKSYDGYLSPVLLILKDEKGDLKKTICLNDLLTRYYSSKNDVLKDEFLNACLIFDKAQKLSHFDMSVSYILMVSAIETLIQIEFKGVKFKKCECCESTQYQVMKKFRDFIDKYGYEIDKKTKNEFYQMRSDISHSGKLFQSSYLSKMFVESQDDFDKVHKSSIEHLKYSDFKKLTKTCFRTFLYKNF